MLYWRVVAWGGALSTLPHFALTPASYPPVCQQHALAPRCSGSGAVVPSERQWVTQRPRSDEKRTVWTVGVTPVACRPQQTRATVPWVAPQPNALVQLMQPQRLVGTCSLDAQP